MHISVTKKITIGSSAFFSGMPGFFPKDADELHLIDYPLFGSRVGSIRKGKSDVFLLYPAAKDRLIEDCLSSGIPMSAGKFLVPEFAEEIGMDISDLERLRPMFETMDERHSYELVIFSAYLSNGGFFLTDEQRADAFAEYLSVRPQDNI